MIIKFMNLLFDSLYNLINMEYFLLINKFTDKLTNKEFKDLARCLVNLENSIIYRQGHYIKLDIRYIHDILKYLLKKYLLELEDEIKESNIYSYIIGDHNKFSLNKLADEIPDDFWISIYDKKNLKRIFKEGNEEVHYDMSKSFDEVMGNSHEKQYSSKDMIGIAMAIFFILKWFGIKVLKLNLNEYDGLSIPDVFNDGSKSFDVLPNKNALLSYLGKNCPLCEVGEIIKPERNNFPYGPYLKCSNDECGANVSKSLKIRRKTNISCETIGCLNSQGEIPKLKETYDLKENVKFNGCIICGNIEKNTSMEEHEFDYWRMLED